MHLRSSESHVFTGDRMLYSCLGTSSDVVNPIIWGFKYDDGSFNYSYYAFGKKGRCFKVCALINFANIIQLF